MPFCVLAGHSDFLILKLTLFRKVLLYYRRDKSTKVLRYQKPLSYSLPVKPQTDIFFVQIKLTRNNLLIVDL